MSKIMNAVICLRRDYDYNFDAIKNIFVPANGEVVLIDTATKGLRAKVGDGISTLAELPYTDKKIADFIAQVEESAGAAADRASQSAITAGNYAAQAIQARNDIEGKIWYGTMAEYNALDTVSSSSIYIILHD